MSPEEWLKQQQKAAAPTAAASSPKATLSPEEWLKQQPPEPAAAPPAQTLGILESIGEMITGSRRATPESQALPEWTGMPELNQMSVASFKTALGTLLSNPQETVNILKANFPDVGVRQDAKGNFILKSSVDQKEYVIPPGFAVGDIPRAIGGLAAFTPAGRAATIPGAIGGAAATQAVIEATQAGTGGEFNPAEVAVAGALGPAGQIIQRAAPAIQRGVRAVTGRAAAAPAAVPPPQVSIVRPPAEELAQRMQAQAARAEAAGTAQQAPMAAAPASTLPPIAPMPEVKSVALSVSPLEGKTLSAKSVADRTDVLKSLGFEEGQMRQGARTGDKWQANKETQLSKMEDGAEMRDQFELETQKMSDYAQGIANELGVELKKAPIDRGSLIISPLEQYAQAFKQRISSLYKAADEVAAQSGGIQLNNFQNTLGKNSMFATNEAVALRKGVRSYLKEQGLIDKDGNILPMNAQQAEAVKQYMTPLWDRKNANAYSALRDSLDDDVISVLGEQVYGPARALRTQYSNIFEKPTSIAKLLDIDGPEGINRAVSKEKVADFIASKARTDQAQFKRIIDTLDGISDPSLQPLAQNAIKEIRGSILDDIFKGNLNDQMVWSNNPQALTKALAPYGGKLDAILGDATANRLRTLKAGSHILQKVDQNPSGSATTKANLEGIKGAGFFQNIGRAMPTGASGAGLGAMALGPVGAVAGAALEAYGGKYLAKRATQKEIAKSLGKKP
jgi:hypothetical protein